MMVNSLEATKVAKKVATVEVVNDCSSWNGSQARFYYGRIPSIKICAPEMDSPFDIQESVQHEAIHLAQWCNGSQSFYNIDAMKREDRDKHASSLDWAHEMASKYYKPHKYDSEFEAYYLMDNSPNYITEMIHEGCK